jgi:serine protease SohB
MMEFLYEVGVFTAEALVLVVAILLVAAGLIMLGARRRGGGEEGYIEVRQINDRYKSFQSAVLSLTESKEESKAREKEEKLARKADEKAAKQRLKRSGDDAADNDAPKPRIFLLNFDGDMRASQTEALREEISALLPVATPRDEVVVRLESPGGLVHGYGLAASQLRRVRDAGVPLTVVVDKVAASGGYMMACVADRILAAPFAVLGSIGVLAQLPNFHRLLKKNDVDFELFTAGEYKRTVTMFGENTDKGRKKFVEELEDTHALFKQFVADNRPAVDIQKVATGEVWYGQRAIDVGLIDELATSDSYLQSKLDVADILEIRFRQRPTLQERLGLAAEQSMERVFYKIWQQGMGRFLP